MTILRVALVGRYAFTSPPIERSLDYPVLRGVADRSLRLDLLVQGSQRFGVHVVDERLRLWYGPTGNSPLATLRFVRWASRTLVRIAREDGLDVVNGSDLFGGLAGLLSRRLTSAALVVQLQGDFFHHTPGAYRPGRGRLVRELARTLARRADGVRCLFEESANTVRALGVASSRIVVLPSRCDTSLFDPTRFSMPPERRSLLFVGSVVAAKGVAELLAAVAQLRSKGVLVRLTVVGTGRDLVAMQRRAAELGVPDAIVWTGRVPHDELPQVFARHALLVLPSRSEATPRTILEAMAMGRPVVATRVGGVGEMVEEGVTGYLVSPGDPQALAEAIERALARWPWPAEASTKARDRVIQRYSLASHISGLVSLHEVANSMRTVR